MGRKVSEIVGSSIIVRKMEDRDFGGLEINGNLLILGRGSGSESESVLILVENGKQNVVAWCLTSIIYMFTPKNCMDPYLYIIIKSIHIGYIL